MKRLVNQERQRNDDLSRAVWQGQVDIFQTEEGWEGKMQELHQEESSELQLRVCNLFHKKQKRLQVCEMEELSTKQCFKADYSYGY